LARLISGCGPLGLEVAIPAVSAVIRRLCSIRLDWIALLASIVSAIGELAALGEDGGGDQKAEPALPGLVVWFAFRRTQQPALNRA
jgi:hypothetical protein